VVWYTGQFYALTFLQAGLKVDWKTAYTVMAIALFITTPLFVFFGRLSDKIGRKKIMLAGMLLGALLYVPIYHGMVKAANTGVVKLEKQIVKGEHEPKLVSLTADHKTIIPRDKAALPASQKSVAAGKGVVPPKPPNFPLLVFYIFLQMIFVTMVYGPIAAYLVEAFPAKVRYTSLSLPYHLGNGVFGGLLPLIGIYITASTKNLYAGLYYPIIVASITFVVGSFLLKETHATKIWDELDNPTGTGAAASTT
jgi:MHS family proline/betaine transporter-like MFS transporter